PRRATWHRRPYFPSPTPEHALRVSGDHQFLVRGNDPGAHPAAGRADSWAALRVRIGVELDTEPGGVSAHALANGRRVLADSSREDDGVESAERRGKRAELTTDPVHVQVDGEPRRRSGAPQQHSHIAGDAGDAQQSGFAIDESLDGARVHL